MKIVLFVLAVAVFLLNPLVSIVIIAVLAWYQTNEVQTAPEQQQFLTGHLPTGPLDGFYRGSTAFYRASWQGKKFFSAENRGINIFHRHGGDQELYPFKTYTGKGLRDAELEVFKIDYRLPGVPWYARPILDEVIEIQPGKFLGKIHYRLIPWFPFTIGYFWLEK